MKVASYHSTYPYHLLYFLDSSAIYSLKGTCTLFFFLYDGPNKCSFITVISPVNKVFLAPHALSCVSSNYYIFNVFTEKPYNKPLECNHYLHSNNNIKSHNVMAVYNLIGCHRCSTVSRKTACKCFTCFKF